jgi:glycosyltransferase involved in cell wall biosynthesis
MSAPGHIAIARDRQATSSSPRLGAASLRVAVCADYPEEGWPSMDRVATMLLAQLRRDYAGEIRATAVCPPFKRRAKRLRAGRPGGAASMADRLINRLWDYPRHVARLRADHEVFHVVDHSYSQLVHQLPGERTVVTCHDLDTFRSILCPREDRHSGPFRVMTRRILAGFRRAARITCDTAAIRDEIVSFGLVAPDRLVVAPVGVGASFASESDPVADRTAARLTGTREGTTEILHVGSTIPRKRIDVVLRVLAEVGHGMASLQLVRVGGPFTAGQQRLARDLGVDGRISVLDRVDEPTLAALYRRAALVLLPSDREGFGLPLAEALACGTPVLASDIAVLREVGGDAAEYCAPGDVAAWCVGVTALLEERRDRPNDWAARRAIGIARARQFTWEGFARQLTQIYAELAYRCPPVSVPGRSVVSPA